MASAADSDDSLFYPPGYVPTPHDNDAGIAEDEARVYLFSAVAPKYTSLEAKLRLLSCCRDLGISTTQDVKYPDIQKTYELKFGIRLDKDEMIQLFDHRKTTKALKDTVETFLVITEASQNADKVIKLRLREGMEEYIKNMEERYDGEEMRELTADEIYDILHPPPSTYRYSRRPIHGFGQDQPPCDEEEPGVEVVTPLDEERRQQDFDQEEQQLHHGLTQRRLYEDDDQEGIQDITPHTQGQQPRDQKQPGAEAITPHNRNEGNGFRRQQGFNHEEQQQPQHGFAQQRPQEDDREDQGVQDAISRAPEQRDFSRRQHGYDQQQPHAGFTPRHQQRYGHQHTPHHGLNQQHPHRSFNQQQHQNTDQQFHGLRNQHQQPRYDEQPGVRIITPRTLEQRSASRQRQGFAQQKPHAGFTPRHQQSYGHQHTPHHGYNQQHPHRGFNQQQHQNTDQQFHAFAGHHNQHQQPRYEEQQGVRIITPRTTEQRDASRQRHGFDRQQPHHSSGHQQPHACFTPRQHRQSFGHQQPPHHHGFNQQQPQRLCGFNRSPSFGTNNSSNYGSAANTLRRSSSVQPQQRFGQRQQQPRRSHSQQRRTQQNGNEHVPVLYPVPNVDTNNSNMNNKNEPAAATSNKKVKKYDRGVFGTSTSSIDQTYVKPIAAKYSKKDLKRTLTAAKHVKLENHKKMINDVLNQGLQKLEKHKETFIKESNDQFETKYEKLLKLYQSKLTSSMDRRTEEKLNAKLAEGIKQLKQASDEDIKNICDSCDAAVKELEEGVQEMILKFEELYFPKK